MKPMKNRAMSSATTTSRIPRTLLNAQSKVSCPRTVLALPTLTVTLLYPRAFLAFPHPSLQLAQEVGTCCHDSLSFNVNPHHEHGGCGYCAQKAGKPHCD